MRELRKTEKITIIIGLFSIGIVLFQMYADVKTIENSREQYSVIMTSFDLLNKQESRLLYNVNTLKYYNNVTTKLIQEMYLENNLNDTYHREIIKSNNKEINSLMNLSNDMFLTESDLRILLKDKIEKENSNNIKLNLLKNIIIIIVLSGLFIILLYVDDVIYRDTKKPIRKPIRYSIKNKRVYNLRTYKRR
jgi:hypothetical protein